MCSVVSAVLTLVIERQTENGGRIEAPANRKRAVALAIATQSVRPRGRLNLSTHPPLELSAQSVMSVLRAIRDEHTGNVLTALSRPCKSRNLTYGELEPCFVYGLLEDLRVTPNSLVVDLGSGAGNLVIQAAIQTGCTAFGIELRAELAAVAADAVVAARKACDALHINIGQVALAQGDMLTSDETTKALVEADVVIVNNKVFDSYHAS